MDGGAAVDLLVDLRGLDLLGLMARGPYPKRSIPRQPVALSQAVTPGLPC
jgi:hypothetical protein